MYKYLGRTNCRWLERTDNDLRELKMNIWMQVENSRGRKAS